jgi:hypothetical protein
VTHSGSRHEGHSQGKSYATQVVRDSRRPSPQRRQEIPVRCYSWTPFHHQDTKTPRIASSSLLGVLVSSW